MRNGVARNILRYDNFRITPKFRSHFKFDIIESGHIGIINKDMRSGVSTGGIEYSALRITEVPAILEVVEWSRSRSGSGARRIEENR